MTGTIVYPENWFSALSGERRMVGNGMVEFVSASRNTLILTAWGTDDRFCCHEWHPTSHAHVTPFAGELSGVPVSFSSSTPLHSTDVS